MSGNNNVTPIPTGDDGSKLEWMYKGLSGAVDREEYLLGRPVDKTFEHIQQNASGSNMNAIERDCLPTSIFSSTRTSEHDLARKLQEDPLYAIKKKEIESRQQLFKNPVKLKQLQNMIKEKRELEEKLKKKSKKKKKKKKTMLADSEGANLDSLLAAKFMKLKKQLGKHRLDKLDDIISSESSDSDREEDIVRPPKLTLNQNKGSRNNKIYPFDGSKSSHNFDDTRHRAEGKSNNKYPNAMKHVEKSVANTDYDISRLGREAESSRHKKRSKDAVKLKKTGLESSLSDESQRKMSISRSLSTERRHHSSSSAVQEDNKKLRSRNKNKHSVKLRKTPDTSSAEEDRHSKQKRGQSESSDEGRISKKGYGLVLPAGYKASSAQEKVKTEPVVEEKKRWVKPKRVQLSDEEKARRRQEMLDNAKWREEQREKNVARFRIEEKRGEKDVGYSSEFLRTQLSKAVSQESVASRIKSNVNNIQRSHNAMDKNFARR